MLKMCLIVVIFVSTLFSPLTHGIEGTYELIVKKKQEEKKRSRWTLMDWLATKRRMDLMDQWLLLNTENNYFEIYLDASLASVEDDTSPPYYLENSYQRYKAGIFFLPFGIEYKLANLGSGGVNTDYMLSLRLLGSSLQTTNLILSYGKNIRENDTLGDLDNSFFQVRSNFYFADFIGIAGSYRKYSGNTNDAGTFDIEGSRISYTVFLELELLRFYFESFTETNELTLLSNGSESERENKGSFFGIRIFL